MSTPSHFSTRLSRDYAKETRQASGSHLLEPLSYGRMPECNAFAERAAFDPRFDSDAYQPRKHAETPEAQRARGSAAERQRTKDMLSSRDRLRLEREARARLFGLNTGVPDTSPAPTRELRAATRRTLEALEHRPTDHHRQQLPVQPAITNIPVRPDPWTLPVVRKN